MLFRRWKKKTASDRPAPETPASAEASHDDALHGALLEAAAQFREGRTLSPAAPAPMPEAADIRLFPGFEREDFEVGFATDGVPALLMRWRDGGEWFALPPMFNLAVLTAIRERHRPTDLLVLLQSQGYDVPAAAERLSA